MTDAILKEDDLPQLHLSNQLCFPLYACGRKVVNCYIPFLEALDLTYTQYLVMMVLWEEKHLEMRKLCQKLRLDSGTLTPVLKKMQAKGYLTRQRSEKDERQMLIQITEEGWALREKASRIPQCSGEKVDLTPEEAMTLYKLLYKVLDGIPD